MDLRGLCEFRGITLADLAKATGIGRNTIYRLAEDPDIILKMSGKYIKAIASVLGYTMDNLVFILTFKVYDEDEIDEYIVQSIDND